MRSDNGSFAVTCLSLVASSVLPESATLTMIVAFAIFTLTMSAFSNLVGVFPPECFPTEVRACGVGLAIACSRIGSAVGTYLGFHTTMMVLAAVLLVGMVVSIAWAPETKHLTLNEASGAQGKTVSAKPGRSLSPSQSGGNHDGVLQETG